MVTSKDIVLLCSEGEMHNLTLKIIGRINALRPSDSDLKLSHINYSIWRDGEYNDKIPRYADLAGKHVVFFMASHGNGLVLQGLQLLWAIKHQYGAKTLTVVMPFLAYRRQDHAEKAKEIQRNLWFLYNLKQNGVDNLIVCDRHSERTMINGREVGLQMINVDPTPSFAAALTEALADPMFAGLPAVIYSPDRGSLERTVALAKSLGLSVIFHPKKRLATGQIDIDGAISPDTLEYIDQLIRLQKIDIKWEDCASSINGAIVIIRDDELDTGRTAASNARYCLSLGAKHVIFVVTHTCCSPGWREEVADPDTSPFRLILAGDTIYRPYRNTTGGLIRTIDMSKVIGQALANLLAVL